MEFSFAFDGALRVNSRDGEVAVGAHTALLDLPHEQPDLTSCPLQGERR